MTSFLASLMLYLVTDTLNVTPSHNSVYVYYFLLNKNKSYTYCFKLVILFLPLYYFKILLIQL